MLQLVEATSPVRYSGPVLLTQFRVTGFTSNTSLVPPHSRFIFSVRLARLWLQPIATTFFQSFLLWFVAYCTLYIDITDFTNRFMGALTRYLD